MEGNREEGTARRTLVPITRDGAWGVKIYETAVRCAQNDDLEKEWGKYLDETRNHEVVMLRVLDAFGLDAETETPGRQIVRTKGEALVASMETALRTDPAAAQLVAAECVVEAETKDHMNWELIGEAAEKLTGEQRRSRRPTARWRSRRTSTSITRWDGPESSGSSPRTPGGAPASGGAEAHEVRDRGRPGQAGGQRCCDRWADVTQEARDGGVGDDACTRRSPTSPPWSRDGLGTTGRSSSQQSSWSCPCCSSAWRSRTSRSIGTLLMVFILQNTQNRDSAALHLKLDEMVRAEPEARDDVRAWSRSLPTRSTSSTCTTRWNQGLKHE